MTPRLPTRQGERRSCPHCGIAEVPCEKSRGGSNGITESAIEAGIALMARMDPERTPQQNEYLVRALINGVRHHLVQRHLYDAVVRELRPEKTT